MNKLIAIAIVFGLVLSSAVRAEGASCNSSCSTEQSQCIGKLGKAATGNCNDGFRLCVQRCDPRRMNTAYLESDAARRIYQRRDVNAAAQACAGHCALSARTCVDSGNGRNECRNAQMACEDRCSSS